jgi:hypothetical protein
MDEVSDGVDFPVRHEMPLSTMLHCSAIFASKKKGLGGRESSPALKKPIALPSPREGPVIVILRPDEFYQAPTRDAALKRLWPATMRVNDWLFS